MFAVFHFDTAINNPQNNEVMQKTCIKSEEKILNHLSTHIFEKDNAKIHETSG
jgi:hypothetical protein